MQKNGSSNRKTSDPKYGNTIRAPNNTNKYNSEDEDEDRFLNPHNYVHKPVDIESEPEF